MAKSTISVINTPVTMQGSLTGSGLTVSYRVKDGLCQIRLNGSTSSAISSGTKVVTLPEGAWPVYNPTFVVMFTTSAELIRCSISTSGEVSFTQDLAKGLAVRGTAVFMTS